MREIKLEDVDGTVKGRAALVIINLNDPWSESDRPDIMRADFDESDDPNPAQACQKLWEGTREDWPDYHHTVVANERARYLDWAVKMEAIGITGNTPEQYVTCCTAEPTL